MPYDPLAPDEASHALLFRMIHLAAIAALVATGIYLASGTDNSAFRILALLAGLPLIYPAIPSRHFDAYARSLMRVGASWAVTVVGGWLAIRGVIGFGELGHAAGVSAGASDIAAGFSGRDPAIMLPGWFDDVVLLTLLVACAFHAGFQWAYRRGDA